MQDTSGVHVWLVFINPVRDAVASEGRDDHPHRIDSVGRSADRHDHLWRHKGRLPRHGPGLIQDVKATGVRISLLSPGAVDTPSLRRALGKAGGANNADAVIKSIGARSPLGRIGDASEIGKAAVFLASDALPPGRLPAMLHAYGQSGGAG